MKDALRTLFKSILRFGVWNGPRLYLQLLVGQVRNIKVPNIKHSISLRPRSSDIPTFYQVFFFNEYDIFNQYTIKINDNPKLIIDGGANVGLFAVKMKNKFPEAKIISIEPDPDNFHLLRNNLSKYNNVFFENSGLWNKDTKLRVYDKYNYGKWGMVVEEDLQTGTVSAISLNSLLEKYSIEYVDILKVDIETSEKQLFSDNYEKWLPKIKTIVIELHDWIEPGCSKPFFIAINKCFSNYHLSFRGENVIITNLDIA